MTRRRGRPRKYPVVETAQNEAVIEQTEPETSDEVRVRLGFRSCMTSKGASRPGSRIIRPGAIIPLPAHEAQNLVTMGYATYA